MSELDPNRFSVHGTSSTLVYRPHPTSHAHGHNDAGHLHVQEASTINHPGSANHQSARGRNVELYGMVFCKANNSYGNQEEPCVFVISPAGE